MTGMIWWCDDCGHAQTDRFGSVCVKCGYVPSEKVFPYLVKRVAELQARYDAGKLEKWEEQYLTEIARRVEIYKSTRGL